MGLCMTNLIFLQTSMTTHCVPPTINYVHKSCINHEIHTLGHPNKLFYIQFGTHVLWWSKVDIKSSQNDRITGFTTIAMVVNVAKTRGTQHDTTDIACKLHVGYVFTITHLCFTSSTNRSWRTSIATYTMRSQRDTTSSSCTRTTLQVLCRDTTMNPRADDNIESPFYCVVSILSVNDIG